MVSRSEVTTRSRFGGSRRAYDGLFEGFYMAPKRHFLVLCPHWTQLCRGQIPHPDQVVGRQRDGEHPAHLGETTMTSLAQPRDGLEPGVDLFDSFALLLTDSVARMAYGPHIDNAGRLACDVWRHLMLAQLKDEL